MEESVREQLLILWTTPIYALVILVEILLSNWHHKDTYSVKDTFSNFLLMLLNGGLDLVFRTIYVALLMFCWNYRIAEIHTPWMYWLTLLITEDFLFYWLHRFDHQVRLLWAVHVTHHSSDKLNLTVGFRSSVLQPLYRFIYFIPLAFVGFKPMDIVFMYSATQIWGILIHTEFVNKLGWLEYILVTPSHHRVHHASNAIYLDRNMGMFLIIWDKMFGTFQPELSIEEYQPIKYGLTTPLKRNTPGHIITHEWVAIVKDVLQKGISWQDRINYLLGPPGWSHDGSRKTSDQMRKEEISKT